MPRRPRKPQLHEQLLSLLPVAEASSGQVVATFLDIRGFSAFAAGSESFDAASYLRSIYTKILTNVYPDASFFKPTGDGLLLVHDLAPSAESVPPLVSSVLSRAIDLANAFPTLTDDDLMVNFTVPDRLGIGVARGAATRLMANGQVLDYTGRCLNLASRLMDKARPCGVVFSDRYASQLMGRDTISKFRQDEVYVRGIAEEKPLSVWISSTVQLSEEDRLPIAADQSLWSTPIKMPVNEVKNLERFLFPLRRKPKATENVGVHVMYPAFDSQHRSAGTSNTYRIDGTFHEEPEGPYVLVEFDSLLPQLTNVPKTVVKSGRREATIVEFTAFIEPRRSTPPAN